MASKEEQVLRVAKEVVVKFIEVGRLSPASFQASFMDIYNTINDTVNNNQNKSDTKKENL